VVADKVARENTTRHEKAMSVLVEGVAWVPESGPD